MWSLCLTCPNFLVIFLVYFNDVEVILKFKGTFCWELVVSHTTPSMFGKFSVHAWRQCSGLNKEHSVLVH